MKEADILSPNIESSDNIVVKITKISQKNAVLGCPTNYESNNGPKADCGISRRFDRQYH